MIRRDCHTLSYMRCSADAGVDVVHSCVGGVPRDGEGELLHPGGSGAWQDLQGLGDGCQLHRLLSAQREALLQDRSVMRPGILNMLFFCFFYNGTQCEGVCSSWQRHRCLWSTQNTVLSRGTLQHCAGAQQNRSLNRATPWSTAASMRRREKGSGMCIIYIHAYIPVCFSVINFLFWLVSNVLFFFVDIITIEPSKCFNYFVTLRIRFFYVFYGHFNFFPKWKSLQ